MGWCRGWFGDDFGDGLGDALRDAKNERLWFKTMTKLGKLYFDREEFNRLSRILKQSRQSCQTDEGEDDLKKGTDRFKEIVFLIFYVRYSALRSIRIRDSNVYCSEK